MVKLNLKKAKISRGEVRIFTLEIVGLVYGIEDRSVAVAERGGRLKIVDGGGLGILRDFGR